MLTIVFALVCVLSLASFWEKSFLLDIRFAYYVIFIHSVFYLIIDIKEEGVTGFLFFIALNIVFSLWLIEKKVRCDNV